MVRLIGMLNCMNERDLNHVDKSDKGQFTSSSSSDVPGVQWGL